MTLKKIFTKKIQNFLFLKELIREVGNDFLKFFKI